MSGVAAELAFRVSPGELERFTATALSAAGLPADDADQAAGLITLADLRGADGHGVFRLPQYVRRLRAGGINPAPSIDVVRSGDSTGIVDGDNGFGHLVVSRAARSAVDLARETGVGWVGVRNSNHAGPASIYAMIPLEAGMIGLYCAVGSANHMAPWGGTSRLLSTNPIAIAVPTEEHPPIVFDMATSVVSYGTIKRHAARGEPMPEGWMIDGDGEPLLDPSRSDDGLLLPVGEHKGYGLSLMVTLLAGALNGAAIGKALVDFNHDDVTPANTGQAVVAVDVARFVQPREAFTQRIDAFIDELKASPTLPGVDEIRLPGERSHATFAERRISGVPVRPELREQLEGLAGELDIEPLRRG